MIIHVESHERAGHAREMAGYFRLRGTAFHGCLGWHGYFDADQQRDELDDLPCTYCLSIDDDGAVYGGARLIPTTQTTFLDLAFDGLVPQAMSFRSPTVWEISRLCIAIDSVESRLPSPIREISLANLDYARRNGITHFLTVTDQYLFDLTRQLGFGVTLLDRQLVDGSPVVCGLIAIDGRTLAAAKRIRQFTQAPRPSCRDATSHVPEPAASRSARETPGSTTRSPQA